MNVNIVNTRGNKSAETSNSKVLHEIFKGIENTRSTHHKAASSNEIIYSTINHDGQDSYSVIIYAECVTNHTADSITKFLNSLSTLEFDILYLCRWGDKCHLYDSYQVLEGFNIYRTYYPTGLIAFIISPSGKKKLLEDEDLFTSQNIGSYIKSMINKGQLVAKTVSPNMFDFDFKYSRRKEDYNMLNQCETSETNSDNSNSMGYGIVILIIVLIALFVAYRTSRS